MRRFELPPHGTSSSSTSPSPGLSAVRYGVGVVVVLSAVVVLVVVPGDVGFISAMAYGVGSALGAALILMLLNLLYGMTIGAHRERQQEEEARRYLDERGVWPDGDAPSGNPRGERRHA